MSGNHVRLNIPLPSGAAGASESVWAVPLENGLYRIENIPFEAFGINLGDIVSTSQEAGLQFEAVVEASGHRTFRILIWPDVDPSDATDLLATLEQLGCGIERATERWIAIDVPPEVTPDEVTTTLEKGWRDRIWRYVSGEEAGSYFME